MYLQAEHMVLQHAMQKHDNTMAPCSGVQHALEWCCQLRHSGETLFVPNLDQQRVLHQQPCWVTAYL